MKKNALMLISFVVVMSFSALSCGGGNSQAAYTLEKLDLGLSHAWGIASLPDGALLITEKRSGNVWHVNPVSFEKTLIFRFAEIFTKGQGGVFSVLIDRDFENNRQVYFSYAIEDDSGKTTTALAKGVFNGLDIINIIELFRAMPFYDDAGHFGGGIAQDDKGFVYLGIGDRHAGEFIQREDNHLGKVIKVDVNTQVFEVISAGHRNPQGLFWVEGLSMLLEAEHGPKGGDEVNHIRTGKNYGWPLVSYGVNYDGTPVGSGESELQGYESPLFYYVPSIATSDIHFYRSDRWPELKGKILVASLRAGIVSVLAKDSTGEWFEETRLFESFGQRWRGIEVDASGNIYLLSEKGLYRVTEH